MLKGEEDPNTHEVYGLEALHSTCPTIGVMGLDPLSTLVISPAK